MDIEIITEDERNHVDLTTTHMLQSIENNSVDVTVDTSGKK